MVTILNDSAILEDSTIKEIVNVHKFVLSNKTNIKMSKRILNIVTSVKGDASFSNKLSNAILEKLKAEHNEIQVQTLDLSKTPLPYVTHLHISSVYVTV